MGELKRIWQNKVTKEYVISGLQGAERTNLVCDTVTKVVYYQLCNGSICPYISENGKLCRLVGYKIIEIN